MLIELDYKVIILDNLYNSNKNVIDNINKITKKTNMLEFVYGDIRDSQILNSIFEKNDIKCVLHFAALKSVSDSDKNPELYRDVNVNGTINILSVMEKFNCYNFVYSSSATVYGDSKAPVNENSVCGNNLACQYAHNKYDMEQILMKDYSKFNIVILRYFNPIGCHKSGLLIENPSGTPTNIFPYLIRVADAINNPNSKYKTYKTFTIYGNKYNTSDGTCIRDYVHVEDLSRAHVEVLKLFDEKREQKLFVYNVGTGIGTSVLELLHTLNKILIKKKYKPIKFGFGDKRNGDLEVSYSDPSLIFKDLHFKTQYNIYDMCEHGLYAIGLV